MSVHNLNECIQFGQGCIIWKSVEILTSVYNLDECVQFGRVGTIWTSALQARKGQQFGEMAKKLRKAENLEPIQNLGTLGT